VYCHTVYFANILGVIQEIDHHLPNLRLDCLPIVYSTTNTFTIQKIQVGGGGEFVWGVSVNK